MDATDLCYTPATELAAMIRARSLSPVELTRAVLERIERAQPAGERLLHAHRGGRPGPAREAEADVMAGSAARADPRHPVLHQGPHVHARRAHDGRLVHLRRPGARRGRRRSCRVWRRRAAIFLGKTTTPEFGWKGISDSPADRRHAEPVEPGHDDRRLERGRGGGGGRRARALAPGLGRRGLHPDPLGVLRRVRPQAVVRTGAAVAGVEQRPDHPQRPHDADGGGRGADAVGDGGPGRARPHVAGGRARGLRGPARGRAAGMRVAWSPDLDGLRVDPEVAEIAARAARVLRATWAPTWRR